MEERKQMKPINLEELIKAKNPRLLRFMPGFVLNYIRRVIHEKDVNDFLKRHGHRFGFEFIKAILEEFRPQLTVEGIENIPAKGGCIIAANHPLGGLDAMTLMDVISKVRTDQKFLVNDILMNLSNLEELFLAVNKHGKNSQEALDKIEAAYQSEQCILIFPAGLVSRKGDDGKIRDLEWKKSFITKSKKHDKPVIPVFIDAENSKFFYNFARLRKKFGVKANIEMFWLVDEMYHQRNKKIRIIIGKPISPETFDRSKTDAQWAETVKAHLYELGTQGKPLYFNSAK